MMHVAKLFYSFVYLLFAERSSRTANLMWRKLMVKANPSGPMEKPSFVKAPTKTLKGTIDKISPSGICVNGTWYSYGRTFQGERPGQAAVGATIELTLVDSTRDGKSYIRSVAVESAPAETDDDVDANEEDSLESDVTETAAQATEDVASPEALKYAEDLALKAGIKSADLEEIVRLRFQKDFAKLAKADASKVIEFFGGYVRNGARRFGHGQ